MARCKICHRELTNADHIAQGMGPVCAAKAARGGSGNTKRAYPADRYQRLVRGVERLTTLAQEAAEYLGWARFYGTPAELAEGEWEMRLIRHWFERAVRLEQRVRTLAA